MSKEIFKGNSVSVSVDENGDVDVRYLPAQFSTDTTLELAKEIVRLHDVIYENASAQSQLLQELLEKFDSEVGNVSTEVAEWAKVVTEIVFDCEPAKRFDYQIRIFGDNKWLSSSDVKVIGETADAMYVQVVNTVAPTTAAPATPMQVSPTTVGAQALSTQVYLVDKRNHNQYRRVIRTWHVVNIREGVVMKSDFQSYDEADEWIGKNSLRDVAKVRNISIPL